MRTGTTSFKDTLFGILPRQKVLKLEIEGNKKGIEFIAKLNLINSSGKTTERKDIDIPFILKLHKISYAWIFPKWAGKFRTINVTYSGKEAMQMADEGNYLPLEKLIEEAFQKA